MMSDAQEQHHGEELSLPEIRENLEAPPDLYGHEADADEQDDETSFGLLLEEKGQTGGYHTSNDPNNRFHRATVTDRHLDSAIDVRGSSKVIIHGRLSPESDKAATLLVYEFAFNKAKRFRRVALANITFEFSSDGPGPEVQAVAPSGLFCLAGTTQKEHSESSTSANLSIGYQGASAGGTQAWTKSVDREGKDYTAIYGNTTCDRYGKETGAKFTLLENASASPKTGVPASVRLAILLARSTDDEFQCTVNIEIEADWKTRRDTFFAAKTRDDPLYFDPSLPPTNKLEILKTEIDSESLGATRLDELFDANMGKPLENAIKKQD